MVRKLGKSVGYVACTGNGDGKALFCGVFRFIQLLDFVHLPEYLLRVGDKALSLRSQNHSFGRTLKNRYSERILKLFYGAAEIRLSHVEVFGSFIYRAASCNLHRVFQMD